MATGSIEVLRSGFRARVYAGKDPITGKQSYVCGQVWRDRSKAEDDRSRLLIQIEAGNNPDRAATVAVLMKAWAEVGEHELTTRETTSSYVRRIINPALGDWQLRKLQHRVDVLDRFYKHLGRCSALCQGQPFLEHKRDGAHDCDALKCRPHVCKPRVDDSPGPRNPVGAAEQVAVDG